MGKLFLLIFFLTVISATLPDKSQICKNIRTRILKEGDSFEPRRCFICECRNKTLNCANQELGACPEPPCDPSVQKSTSDRCCKICPSVGTRCRFNGMSVDDGENFQLDPCGTCRCQNGKLTCYKECHLNQTHGYE